MATIKVTREALYEQVWTTPMSRLAMHYGISDVALAKTCRRMNIPRPGRGYWQQLAARVKVKRAPLPKVATERERWVCLDRVEHPAPKVPSPTPPEVAIADTLHGAHEVVQRLGSLLQRAKADDFDRLEVPGDGYSVLAVTVATHRRALLLLDSLCKAVVGRGHAVSLRREKTDAFAIVRIVFTVSGVALEAAIVERLDRRERPRTDEEQREAERSAKLTMKPMTEQFASGRLQLMIRGIHDARSSWSDGKTPLERHLGRAVVALEAEAERRRLALEAAELARVEAERRRREQEAEAERQRREREAEKRRRDEADARRQHELGLSRDLRGMARRWAVAAHVRAFLDAVEEAVPAADRGEGFTAWLRWAGEHAEAMDPLSAPQKIAKVLEPDLSKLGPATNAADGIAPPSGR